MLDLATGTADFAIEAYKQIKPQKITGVDLSTKMLEIGRKKLDKLGISNIIKLIYGNAEDLAFKNNTFDLVTISFGLRNFNNIDTSLSEIYRVLNNRGELCILEFSNSDETKFKTIYNLYFSKLLPKIGNSLSKHNFAYNYLYDSVNEFPNNSVIVEKIRTSGFENIRILPVNSGLVTVFYAVKTQIMNKLIKIFFKILPNFAQLNDFNNFGA